MDKSTMTAEVLIERFQVLKSMNTVVKMLNNEDAYYAGWINIIPDEADDKELMCIAFDDEETYSDAVSCFKDIMAEYLHDGLYIGNKLY